MLHTLYLLAVVLSSPAEGLPPRLDAEALFRLVIDRSKSDDDRRTALEDLLRRFHDSPRAPEALLKYAVDVGESAASWEAATEVLRRLQASFSDSREADEAMPLVERYLGFKFSKFPESVKRGLLKGLDEEDLVKSGLEETMATGYQEISDILKKHKKVNDFRTAAFVCAIQKVGLAYLELGVFP